MTDYETINISSGATLQDLEDRVRKLELQPFPQSAVVAKNITNAFASPAFKQGVQGWRLQDNGDAEFNNGTFRGSILIGSLTGQHIFIGPIPNSSSGILEFFDTSNKLRSSFDGSGLKLYDPTGTLTSILRGTNVATDGVDGFALSTSAGINFEYLFSSAGFAMPGGTFTGDILINKGFVNATDSIIFGNGGFITPDAEITFDTSNNTWTFFNSIGDIVIDVGGDVYPKNNDATSLGKSSNKWSDVQATSINGAIPLAGTSLWFVSSDGVNLDTVLTFTNGILVNAA